jgi:exonuclease V gamma subunit
MNTLCVPGTPKAIQDLLDELEASRASRKRAWEILQEIRWVLKDMTGIEAPRPARKTIDLEGRVVKEAVRNALQDRQRALTDLINAIREYRKAVEQPLTLRGSEYAHAVQELNKAIDRAEDLLQN